MTISKWKTLRLDDVAQIERGRFSPRPRNDPRYYGGDIPFVQTGDITRSGTYVREHSQTLNEKGLAVSKLFPKNTILMTIAANIGDVAILNFDSACPDSLVAFTPKSNIDPKWLFHVLKKMKNKFDHLSTQNAQKNLSLEKIKPIQIQVPPYKTQREVASTLNLWDTAIERTEALIDSKERQFGWLVSKIYKRLEKSKLKTQPLSLYIDQTSKIHENTSAIIASVGKKGIRDRAEVYSKELSKDYSKNKLVYKNDITFGLASDCIIYGINSTKNVYSVSPAYKTFKIQGCNSVFLKYLLDHYNSKLSLKYLITSARQGKSVDFDGLLNEKFIFPPIDEQQAIAHTLNTAKQEITLLKKLADQYRMQKRGLMQKLLTGKWRIDNG